MLRFDDPHLLWLAAASLPLALTGVAWFRSMLVSRRLSAALARIVLFVLIAAALAGARRVQESTVLATVAVVDLSESVRTFGAAGGDGVDSVRSFLAESTKDREADDLLGVVVFDRRALAVATPSRADVLARPFEPIGLEGTDIAAGLTLAGGIIPPDATGRLVLFSDGNETVGNSAEVAASLGASTTGFGGGGIAIDVVPIGYRLEREVVVESLDAPPRAAAESTVTLRVVLRSTGPAEGTLNLLREGEPFAIGEGGGLGRRVRLAAGRNIELIQVPLAPGPVHRFEAVFVSDPAGSSLAGDSVVSNNRASGFTLTPGRGSVLLVDGVSEGSGTGPGATLARVLSEGGIEVRTVAPAGFPNQMLELQAYDLIVLQNVPAESLDAQQQELLVSQVRDLGTGLVMVGGPDSFGAGGWHGTAVADILPVRLDLPDQIIVPEAAIVFVLDSSGSMGASVLGSMRTQQQIANQAAAMAIQSLDRTDLVGVIAFNDQYRVVSSLAPNRNADRTASLTRSIASGGGTTLGPAMREAARQLATADAKLKQVIVLSDGRSTDSEFLVAQAESMALQGIRVTTIGVGDDADMSTLADIARAGGGAFYSVINPNLLPRIFLKAVRIVRSPLVREQVEPVEVREVGSPYVAGLGPVPPIGGLVLTREREEAGAIVAMATAEGEPVLAHWNIGLGQVVAFTSDAHEWTRSWLDGPSYRAFWVQLARTAGRVREETSSELTVTASGDGLRMTLDAIDEGGRPLDLLEVPVTVFGAGGVPTETELMQVGPGLYEGVVAAGEPGPYIVVAKPTRGGTRLTPMLAGATVGAGAELARLEPDRALLEAVADRSGGRVLDLSSPSPGLLFERAGVRPHRTSSPLWPVLVAWAILVYLLDVGTRRVAWDRFIGGRMGAGLTEGMRAATATRESRSVSALLASRRNAEPGASVLGAEDAARVAAEAKRARREAAARPRSPDPVAPAPPAGGSDEEGASGLMAAKRRARERYEQQRKE